MQLISSIPELRSVRQKLTRSVGLIPTMGALHAGHLALVRQAIRDNDHVMVSIFVNPTQFTNPEDLERYPRTLDKDLDLLAQSGVTAVFAPDARAMYPPGFQTTVEVAQVSQGMEGKERPGHFRGVATVVNKLFNLVQPDRAYFGQKDAQQIAVIRQMVADLDMPVAVVVVPTVREADGLALSSRNVFLNAAEREAASVIYRAMQAGAAVYDSGSRDPSMIRIAVIDQLVAEPLVAIEYVSVIDRDTMLGAASGLPRPALIAVAVRFGATRLIDNWPLG